LSEKPLNGTSAHFTMLGSARGLQQRVRVEQGSADAYMNPPIALPLALGGSTEATAPPTF
jgi:hypothetical protein